MALPKAHHIETLSEFNSLKFSYDSTNTHYFTGGTSTVVEGTPDILYTDIAYIKPLSCIYTHAKIYPCPVLEYDNAPIANSGNLMTSGNIKSALDNNQRVFYAITETAGATAVKEFTIPNFPTETINGVKTPLKGTILIAQCANADARTAQLKFKVNDGGEFPIWYYESEYTSTSAAVGVRVFGKSARSYLYSFDGTHWRWLSDGTEDNTTYTAGSGLKLSSNQFSLNVPRVTKSANSLPGLNTAIIEEYQNGNYNLPSNAYYHILTFEGEDSRFATQLALGMWSDEVFYRRYASSTWTSWLRLDNPTMDSTPTAGNTSNTVSSAGVKTAIDTAVTDVKEWVVQRYPYYTIYGVQWNTADPSPECVRIGYSSLHVTLPIQSGMVGGTLTDEGVFTPFTHTDDWTSETRDGNIGQVMVKIPRHWRRFEFENTIVRLLMSATPVEGFMEVPEQYVSAYEASLDRTNLKLASVVNLTAQYRGGNNNATWDSEDTAGHGGESHRSLLGRPATNIDLTNFRTYARARKSGETWWNCNTYEVQRALYWLYVVEYATLNSQKAYDASTTTEGYKKGGLGDGVSTWTGYEWNSFNSYYPFVPCGWTDTLGNGSGVRNYTVYNASGTALKTFAVPRYRGIENPWGHIWKHTDGILCNVTASTSPIYATDDPADFSSTSYSAMRLIGNEMRNEAYIKELHLGENGDITAKSGNGSSTSYYCDYHHTKTSSTGLRAVMFGGSAYNRAFDGFVNSASWSAPSTSTAFFGSRLCFKRTT